LAHVPAHERVLQAVAQHRPVRKTSQRIVTGPMRELALDALDGKTVRWKTKARDYGLGGPLLTEDSVIFEDEKRGLSAVDISTGKRRWAIAFGGVATPLASGGGVLLATDDRGRIHVFDARSGKKRWVYDSKEEDVFPSGGPAIAGDVVVAIVKSHLTGLDLESGKLLWKLRYPGTIAWRGKSTPAVRDGVIYVQEYGALHALR
jgi:outer membrane protein assembly factor BamB